MARIIGDAVMREAIRSDEEAWRAYLKDPKDKDLGLLYLQKAVDRLEVLKNRLMEYDHMTNWTTTCKGCADTLDKSYEAYYAEQCEQYRNRIQELEIKLTIARTGISIEG